MHKLAKLFSLGVFSTIALSGCAGKVAFKSTDPVYVYCNHLNLMTTSGPIELGVVKQALHQYTPTTRALSHFDQAALKIQDCLQSTGGDAQLFYGREFSFTRMFFGNDHGDFHFFHYADEHAVDVMPNYHMTKYGFVKRRIIYN